jgi:hypothetical protein
MLLGLAASAAAVVVIAVPAQAQRWTDPGFVAAANVTVHRGDGGAGLQAAIASSVGHGEFRHHRRHYPFPRDAERSHRGRDRFDDAIVYGGYYYEDNPAWQAEGYNDWWHANPSRSVPRWVQNNQGCERQYSTGAGWRC